MRLSSVSMPPRLYRACRHFGCSMLVLSCAGLHQGCRTREPEQEAQYLHPPTPCHRIRYCQHPCRRWQVCTIASVMNCAICLFCAIQIYELLLCFPFQILLSLRTPVVPGIWVPSMSCKNVQCLFFYIIVGHDRCLSLDFRLRTIDAVIITHSHADAIGGL
jgi:hypothetical protein